MKNKNSVPIIFEILLFLVAIIFISPLLLTLLNSFKTDIEIKINILSLPKKLNFINYIEAWYKIKFPSIFFRTLFITTLSSLGIILISSMASYAMVREKSKISWLFFMFFTFSMIVPFHTIMIPLVKNAAALKLTNIIGIIPIYWGLGSPLAIFFYHGFIKSIPLELEEAAAIDGAGYFRIFFTIVLPLLTPVTTTIIILDVLWIWNDFLLPLIILPSTQYTIQLAQNSFFKQFGLSEYGKAMASLVLSASPVVIFFLAMQKYIIKGIMAGAIKG